MARNPNTNCAWCGLGIYRRPKVMKETRYSICSTECRLKMGPDFNGSRKKYLDYIERWKSGEEDGMKGKDGTSAHLKRYLMEKYDNACSKCGWSETHPLTGNIPVELEHIDGDFRNNSEENLDLLCPNCHSLTPTYRALNKGKGRPRK